MTDELEALARRYHAFVKSDGRGFRRHARILQSMWREGQGYDCALVNGRKLGSRLPMPFAQEKLANFLNDNIRDVVRAEVLDSQKSKGKLYGKPRIFDNLLSSQPLCFNLFGELQQDLPLATKVMATMTKGRVVKVTGIEFEWSPGRQDPRFTNDGSAFDIYVRYKTPQGGKGFAGIEVKYHENLKGARSYPNSRYHEIAEGMGCFGPACRHQLQRQPLHQIWRDHLLAGSMLQTEECDFDDGFFIFLYAGDNSHCAEATRSYLRCLTDDSTFSAWTLETFCATVKAYTSAVWIDEFTSRHLSPVDLHSHAQR